MLQADPRATSLAAVFGDGETVRSDVATLRADVAGLAGSSGT
jgi:hypothetical protein